MIQMTDAEWQALVTSLARQIEALKRDARGVGEAETLLRVARDYAETHRRDIEHDINDYGDLRPLLMEP